MKSNYPAIEVLGIVQARMSSTRLPGKVLMKIGPYTALEWTVHRMLASRAVDTVMVATTTNKADRAIVELCRNNNWPVHCGSEEDVLGRTLEAAGVYSPRIIVDVTSDCPFVDPYHIAVVVSKVKAEGADYACNIVPRQWPDGLDIQAYRTAALIRMTEKIPQDDPRREHSGWNIAEYLMRKNREIASLTAAPQFRHPTWRLTLDTQDDLEVLRACWENYIQHHYSEWMFPVTDLILYLNKHPEMLTNISVPSTTPGLKLKNERDK